MSNWKILIPKYLLLVEYLLNIVVYLSRTSDVKIIYFSYSNLAQIAQDVNGISTSLSFDDILGKL